MEILKEFTPYKMEQADKFIMEDFINNEAKDMVELMTRNRLPYLHAAQVGIDKNIAVMMKDKKWYAICNPRYIPSKKAKKIKIQEASFSHIISTFPEILTMVFQTERYMTVMGMYDTYNSNGELLPDSDKFENGEAVIIQALTDIAQGRSITRFPVYEVELGE